ncbi:MAG: transcription-repair coupling factor [Actinomycetota bacterium]
MTQVSLQPLLHAIEHDPSWKSFTSTVTANAACDISAPASVRPLIVSALAESSLVLALTATGREAEDLAVNLRSFLPADSVVEFVSWETLPHERLSPSTDVVGRRLAVLRRLVHAIDDQQTAPRIVVAPIRAILQPIVRGIADLQPVHLRKGDTVSHDDVIRDLVNAGYYRVDMVEKRGQFAVRGGLIDVFPPAEEHPIRIEFWGDDVDEVRTFSLADQRSLGEAEGGLWAPPCRELLITESVKTKAIALMEVHPELSEMLEKISQGIYPEGMEALAPVLADGMDTLLDLLPANTKIISSDPERIRTRTHDLVATSQEFLEASWHNAAAGNATPIDLGAASYRDMAELREIAARRGLGWWSHSPFLVDEEISDSLLINAKSVPTYRGDTEKALADIRAALTTDQRVVVIAAGHGSAQRLAESMSGTDIAARLVDVLPDDISARIAFVVQGNLDHGFVFPDSKLVVVTEDDIAGQRSSTKDMRKMPARRKRAIDPLALKTGDFVVHEQHGVGKYIEMIQREVGGATREYLVIEYAPAKRGHPGDKLFVPTDQLDLVSRYVGGETPSVHRLGGTDWAAAKTRARKAVRQIAGELVRLYAARNAAPGFAFSPDTVWQRELEDAFPYNETPDQLQVIDEVKRDMERSVPMDRVVCGDVGYGKTEIAVRAAFKAVQDGKQVALLVPTTLLVQQHFSTFSERYATFPIRLASLSRFQTDAEAKKVIEDITTGAVDVVIGTHRLFSKEVRFKDLGLVIVDEEQRFGVEHKEYLKALRTNVDVLTMSATPIPRTLEMSLTGIREMSTIATPPEQRHPVLTYVGGYDSKQVAAAIRRELLREGQVFYVHNRVSSINTTAAKLQELVPEARIAVAHGQMNEHQLEQIIVDFWDKKFDVLVSTTIVESGLDIPNANTLILERADAFGLSQLHQLRGRVGRGRERAYAYFLYPPEKPLSETAHERLSTIAQYTDLGSGMQVAMKDLEIRGSGNLLGGEQSGHIADVGFDLYVRLVGEALAEYKGETDTAAADVRIELPLDAHLPHDYVPSERLRLEMYKRLADATTEADIAAVKDELSDRYGHIPQPVTTLLAVAQLRIEARKAGLTEIVAAGPSIRFSPVPMADSMQMRIARLYPRTTIKATTRTIVIPKPVPTTLGALGATDEQLLEWVHGVIKAVTPITPSA